MGKPENAIRFQADENSCTITVCEGAVSYKTSPKTERAWRAILYIAYHQKMRPPATQQDVIDYLKEQFGTYVTPKGMTNWWRSVVHKASKPNSVFKDEEPLPAPDEFYANYFPAPQKSGNPPSRVGLENLEYEIVLPDEDVLRKLGIIKTVSTAGSGPVPVSAIVRHPSVPEARRKLLEYTCQEHENWSATPYSHFLDQLAAEWHAPNDVRRQPAIPPERLYELTTLQHGSPPSHAEIPSSTPKPATAAGSPLLHQLLRDNGPFIVCGPPGHGKSALMRYVAFERAKTADTAPEHLIPLYVSVRQVPPNAFRSGGALESALIRTLPAHHHRAARQVSTTVLWCLDDVSECLNAQHLDGLRDFVATCKCIIAGRPSPIIEGIVADGIVSNNKVVLLRSRDVHTLLSDDPTLGAPANHTLVEKMKSLHPRFWNTLGSTPLLYLALRVLQHEHPCKVTDIDSVLRRLPEVAMQMCAARQTSVPELHARTAVMERLCYELLQRRCPPQTEDKDLGSRPLGLIPLAEAREAAKIVLRQRDQDPATARKVLDFLQKTGLLQRRAMPAGSGTAYEFSWPDLFMEHFAARIVGEHLQRNLCQALTQHRDPTWAWALALAARHATCFTATDAVALLGQTYDFETARILADVNADIWDKEDVKWLRFFADKVELAQYRLATDRGFLSYVLSVTEAGLDRKRSKEGTTTESPGNSRRPPEFLGH